MYEGLYIKMMFINLSHPTTYLRKGTKVPNLAVVSKLFINLILFHMIYFLANCGTPASQVLYGTSSKLTLITENNVLS